MKSDVTVKPVLTADVVNRNGRLYPRAVLDNAIEEFSKRLPILGELEQSNSSTINIDRASHMVEKIYMDGSDMMAQIRMLDTPMGKILKELTVSGVDSYPVSRGTGKLDDNGCVTDFILTTIDIAATTSRIPQEDTHVKFDRVMDDMVKDKLI